MNLIFTLIESPPEEGTPDSRSIDLAKSSNQRFLFARAASKDNEDDESLVQAFELQDLTTTEEGSEIENRNRQAAEPENSLVKIVAGNNKGKVGYVVGRINRRTLIIKMLNSNEQVNVFQTSIQEIMPHDVTRPENLSTSSALTSAAEENKENQNSKKVFDVVKGTNKGKHVFILARVDKQTVTVQELETNDRFNVRDKSLTEMTENHTISSSYNDSLQNSLASAGGLFGPNPDQTLTSVPMRAASDITRSPPAEIPDVFTELAAQEDQSNSEPHEENISRERLLEIEGEDAAEKSPHSCNLPTVTIIRGRHKDKRASLLSRSTGRKNTNWVRFEDGSEVKVRNDSIVFLDEQLVPNASGPVPRNAPASEEPEPLHERQVRRGIVARIRASSSVANLSTIRSSPRLNRPFSSDHTSRAYSPAHFNRSLETSWLQVPNHDAHGLKFGNWDIRRIRIASSRQPTEDVTLLSTMLGSRVWATEAPLTGRSDQKPIDRLVEFSGHTMELISTKIQDDTALGTAFYKPKVIRLVYIITEGPGLEPIVPADLLLRIADFSRLSPRKVMARLELLQSPAKHNVVSTENWINRITMIPDHGKYAGCGFISDLFLEEICVRAGFSKMEAERRVAIQVRMLIPSMGLFKGVLMRHRIDSSGPEMLLPDSMLKVPASTLDPKDQFSILINKNGAFPSLVNELIGRKLDPGLRGAPPEKSFKQAISKPLSKMILRLWKSMGVPERECKLYQKDSQGILRRNHTWLVGVADPTGRLPPDTVYIPGMKTIRPAQVFVTRSPCIKYEDGRVLQAVTSQPPDMPKIDWDWLEQLSFGCLIFSNPRPGKMTIPERIATGDLDGDLYLVCWDETLLNFMKPAPLVDQPMTDDGVLRAGESKDTWLADALDLMVDAGQANNVGQLVGALYTLGEKVADRSPDGLNHVDAISFFEAYNQALEYKKHGRKIVLPEHLQKKLPQRLRQCLTSNTE